MDQKLAHFQDEKSSEIATAKINISALKKPGFLISLIVCAYLLVCALGYLGFATPRTNWLGWFLILTALAYGIGGPYLLKGNLFSKKAILHKEQQDRSFWVILPGFLAVMYGAPLEWLFIPAILPRGWGLISQIIGLIMITGGIALLCWASLTLKDLYSGRIQVREDHRLIQSGPYHFIRHPAYAAYIVMCLGIGIGYSSLISLLSVPLLLVPGLVYRIRIEDNLLDLEFGEQHVAYTQRTKRLIPRIW